MDNLMQKTRDNWSGKFGFIMAAVGSAVGLGNIWRFPYIVGQYGGAIFLIVYVLMIFIMGFPMFSAELAIGRNSQSNVLDMFKKKRNWSFIGWMCIITTFMIISFYSVVGGWLIKYISGYVTGGGFVSGGNYGEVFGGFIASPVISSVFNVIFLALCVLILCLGVKKGIEKISKILMPALFFMLLFVMIVSFTMPGASKGLEFIFVPNIDNVIANGGFFQVFNAALGQAFFSMSIGMGITTTYGSYLKKDANIAKDTVIVCIFDLVAALIAALAIMPGIFSIGAEPAAGPSLLFISLPAVFSKLGIFGMVVAVVFFILVLFAALTSAISILEVLISTLSEKLKLKRVKATLIVGAIILVMSTLVSVGMSGIFGFSIFDLFDKITQYFLLPLTALVTCLHISFNWQTKNAVRELCYGQKPGKWVKWWEVSVNYICPILIIAIFVLGLMEMNFAGIIM